MPSLQQLNSSDNGPASLTKLNSNFTALGNSALTDAQVAAGATGVPGLTASGALVDKNGSPVTGGTVPKISFDPTILADGSLPSGPDTGQSWAAFASPTSPAPLRVAGGRIVHTVNASAQSAGYLQIDCGGKVTRIGAEVAWPAGAVGSVALVIPSAPWASGVLPNAGIHLTVNGNGIWRIDRYVNGSGLQLIADYTTAGRFAAVWDGVLRPLEIYVDHKNQKCRLCWPDGSFSDVTSPYFSSETSNYAIWELYETAGGTTVPAQLGRIWAGTDPNLGAPSSLATKSTVFDAIVGQRRRVNEYTTVGTFGDSIPPNCIGATVTLISSGAGGGSGRRGAAGTVRKGGGSGGPGQVLREYFVPAAALGSSYSVTVPAGGVGGAAVTANDTDGNVGGAGSSAVFTSGSTTLNTLGGSPGVTFDAAGYGYKGVDWGTISGVASNATGLAGASGGNIAGDLPGVSGSGGGIQANDTPGNGGAGKASFAYTTGGAGGTAGVVGGASPTSGRAAIAGQPGDGAGGGAASITAAAQAGADGLGYGAPGAGGGASLNGFASGKGGNAAQGYARVTLILI